MPLLLLSLGGVALYGAASASGASGNDPDDEEGDFFTRLAEALAEALKTGAWTLLAPLWVPLLTLVLLIVGAAVLTRVGFFDAFGKSLRDVADALGLRDLFRAIARLVP